MSLTVPFLDVGFTYRELREEMELAFHRVMESGMYIGGSEVSAFESAFAEYCGATYCVGVGNGLDALVLLLRACGVGDGDEVIVPAHTFIATWLAVSQVGARPVPVDADAATMNMDLNLVGEAVGPRTRAIMPVHLYGQPTQCSALRELAQLHGLVLLEDAAQAHGAQDMGRKVGTLGDAAGFSFYPGKNLGAFGDAGAIVTNSQELAVSVRQHANYGSTEKYIHNVKGANSRLDALQAAFLSVKLKRVASWNKQRTAIADVYNQELGQCEELVLPSVSEDVQPVWHLFVVRHRNRDALQKELVRRGVAAAVHYPIPNHYSNAFAGDFPGARYPVAEEICRTCLSLPVGPHLSTSQAREIAAVVRTAAEDLV
jgi:dTDP-3-amino-3,4,6-trideoxy-alpha-D-glucose transaminase